MFYVDPRFAEDNGMVKWYRFLLPAITKLLQVSNHLDLVRVSQSDPENKKMKDLMFAMTAFNTDENHVLYQSR